MGQHGRKPPNPQKVPRYNGRKPPPPGAHSNRGNSGCAVTALGMLGAALATLLGLAYAVKEVVL